LIALDKISQDPAASVDTSWMNALSSISSGFPTSALASGQAAVANGGQRLGLDAQQVADPNSANADAALLDSSQTLLQAQAGADIIKTADQMLGTLLDAFA
jgi:hypothetical protein